MIHSGPVDEGPTMLQATIQYDDDDDVDDGDDGDDNYDDDPLRPRRWGADDVAGNHT